MTWAAAAAAAYNLYQQDQNQNNQNNQNSGIGGSSSGGGGGGGGMGPAVSTGTSTTVSPTFQQSFTPQVSPVIQVSTGGGEQRASTSQIAPGGQEAKGGEGAPASAAAGTPAGGLQTPPTYITPSFQDVYSPSGGQSQQHYIPQYIAQQAATDQAVFGTGAAGIPWTPLILGGAGLLGLIVYMGGQNKRGAR